MEKIKIGVALGSGGMCGVSHVGFLKALEESGIQIDVISGASAGSVVGGAYASGMTIKEMEDRFKSLKKNEIIDLNVFRIFKNGVFSGNKIEKLLDYTCKCKNVEDCKIKFLPVSVDVLSGKEYVFEKGSLAKAIRASCAIPAVFSPVIHEDKILIDGGTVNLVPFKHLKSEADLIIAVNCLNDYVERKPPKHVIGILINALDLMQNKLWEFEKADSKNYDLYIRDNLEGVNPLDIELEKVQALIDEGYRKTMEYIPQIKQLILQKQEEKNSKLN